MTPVPPSAEHSADSSVYRAALRRERLAARLALDAASHAALSARIEARLRTLLTALPPQTLAFCAPVRGEFDARPLATELLGLRLAGRDAGGRGAGSADGLPRLVARIRDGRRSPRHPDPAGGPERAPTSCCCRWWPSTRNAFASAMAVAISTARWRRWFRARRRSASASSWPASADIHPQAHDLRLDAIVTEAGVFRAG
jgi:5-formyltetrahydrofolate cyclo-ligase